MVGYIEMQDPTTVIAENDEHKKDFEAGRWHRKEVERDEFFGMILQECSPILRRRDGAPNHVCGNSGFRDIYA